MPESISRATAELFDSALKTEKNPEAAALLVVAEQIGALNHRLNEMGEHHNTRMRELTRAVPSSGLRT